MVCTIAKKRNTWNPITINFYYYDTLWKDAVATKSWCNKIRLWFMPLGWRPKDLPAKPTQPKMTIDNPQHYSSTPFAKHKLYLILSCVFEATLMMVVISAKSPWSIIGGVLL